jgi:peptidoglycan hydrolase CwlO-like protein
MSEANWWAATLAAIASGVVSYWISRLSKTYDARGAAEAALIGSGPTIIAEQNRRISELWDQMQAGHKRERKCQEEVNALQTQVTDQRHQIRDLQTKVTALEYKLGTLDDGS